jgi:hypothetical protein
MNTNRWGLLALALSIIALGSALVLIIVPPPKSPIDTASSTPATSTTPAATSTASTTPAGIVDLITISSPLPQASVGSSTLTATGQARGSWYFEASFPVMLKDQSGKTIAQAPATAQSDWMTSDFVPFKITLTYPAQPKGSKGTLVFHNDNPSGDPARDKSVEVPVVFN